jgi:site-specific recombinase XerD
LIRKIRAASIVDTSEMIKSNANLYHVKQLLGHKSFETLNHYARLDITDLRKTHERCHPREKDEH